MKTLPILLSCLLFTSLSSHASGTLSIDEAKKIKIVSDVNEQEKQQVSVIAGLLADYEIEAKKLVSSLDNKSLTLKDVNNGTDKLIDLSELILVTARFRLPQCDAYLSQSMTLKDKISTISHEQLETDYHLDGALPSAPPECYHTKDMFVHPATVLVLTRDDPTLSKKTRDTINAEITEVLAHTAIVRELIIH
jgi:hypothetical protein